MQKRLAVSASELVSINQNPIANFAESIEPNRGHGNGHGKSGSTGSRCHWGANKRYPYGANAKRLAAGGRWREICILDHFVAM